MSILITGSNGLLGQKLVSLLEHEKENFIATGKGENRHHIQNIFYVPLDITNKQQVKHTIEAIKPTIVINTAAMTNVDQCETEKNLCWKLNVHAVEYLTEACQKQNSFFIHISSDFIFDGKNGPYSETDVPNPISFYGESKWEAEKIILKSSLQWAIVRTVLVYGITPNMSRTNIILWVKKNLEEKKHIHVVDDQWRTPTLAEDLAMGIYLIAQKKTQGIFNISGKDLLTPYQMALETARFFHLDDSYIIKSDETKFTQPAKRPAKTGFILTKSINQLGYSPKSFQEGIKIISQQIRNIYTSPT
ncbi:MAG: SDR family oxidoreductase [Chitinophagaceae bacterium]|nr:SDR family oxidoreductase [Chitinophagaceae bacterium]